MPRHTRRGHLLTLTQHSNTGTATAKAPSMEGTHDQSFVTIINETQRAPPMGGAIFQPGDATNVVECQDANSEVSNLPQHGVKTNGPPSMEGVQYQTEQNSMVAVNEQTNAVKEQSGTLCDRGETGNTPMSPRATGSPQSKVTTSRPPSMEGVQYQTEHSSMDAVEEQSGTLCHRSETGNTSMSPRATGSPQSKVRTSRPPSMEGVQYQTEHSSMDAVEEQSGTLCHRSETGNTSMNPRATGSPQSKVRTSRPPSMEGVQYQTEHSSIDAVEEQSGTLCHRSETGNTSMNPRATGSPQSKVRTSRPPSMEGVQYQTEQSSMDAVEEQSGTLYHRSETCNTSMNPRATGSPQSRGKTPGPPSMEGVQYQTEQNSIDAVEEQSGTLCDRGETGNTSINPRAASSPQSRGKTPGPPSMEGVQYQTEQNSIDAVEEQSGTLCDRGEAGNTSMNPRATGSPQSRGKTPGPPSMEGVQYQTEQNSIDAVEEQSGTLCDRGEAGNTSMNPRATGSPQSKVRTNRLPSMEGEQCQTEQNSVDTAGNQTNAVHELTNAVEELSATLRDHSEACNTSMSPKATGSPQTRTMIPGPPSMEGVQYPTEQNSMDTARKQTNAVEEQTTGTLQHEHSGASKTLTGAGTERTETPLLNTKCIYTTMEKIEWLLKILLHSWPVIKQKFGDKTPDNTDDIFRALLKTTCAVSTLLDLPFNQFCRRYRYTPTPHVGPEANSVALGNTSAHGNTGSGIIDAGSDSSIDESQLVTNARSAIRILHSGKNGMGKEEDMDKEVTDKEGTGKEGTGKEVYTNKEDIDNNEVSVKKDGTDNEVYTNKEDIDNKEVGVKQDATDEEEGRNVSIEVLQREINREEVADLKRILHITRGPPWGGLGKPWTTCALDCCIVVAMLLGSKSREPSDKTKFLDLAQYNWCGSDLRVAMRMKERSFEWLVNQLNRELPDHDQLTVCSFLAISRVLPLIFCGQPELTVRLRNKYQCKRCGNHLGNKVTELTFPSPNLGETTLSSFFASIFTTEKALPCWKCKRTASSWKVGNGYPPIRLCVQPAGEYLAGDNGQPFTFLWVQADGPALQLTYTWSGGIFCNNDSHFRVFWRAGSEDSSLQCYDGMKDNGIFKSLNWLGRRDSVSSDFASALFFTLTAVKAYPDEPDNTGSLTIADADSPIKRVPQEPVVKRGKAPGKSSQGQKGAPREPAMKCSTAPAESDRGQKGVPQEPAIKRGRAPAKSSQGQKEVPQEPAIKRGRAPAESSRGQGRVKRQKRG